MVDLLVDLKNLGLTNLENEWHSTMEKVTEGGNMESFIETLS